MTKLLVSVRDAEEARAALAAGADLIDVKEPRRGALGAADPAVVADVVEAVARRLPTSVALGELSELDAAGTLPLRGVEYAKVGLAGCAGHANWQQRWRTLVERFPSDTGRVAVVYADWKSCDAPEPYAVLRAATGLECMALLIDTFDKSRGGLFEHWSPAELARFLAAGRSERLLTVLGGSLRAGTIQFAAQLGPDYVAVRGAVCRGDRAGTVDPVLVRQLTTILAASTV